MIVAPSLTSTRLIGPATSTDFPDGVTLFTEQPEAKVEV